MKVGDLVRLKNVDERWGATGLITEIHITRIGTGQISMITSASPACTIPWQKRGSFIEGVVSESR